MFVVRLNYWHSSCQYTRQFVNFVTLVKYSDALILYIFFLKRRIEINFNRIFLSVKCCSLFIVVLSIDLPIMQQLVHTLISHSVH